MPTNRIPHEAFILTEEERGRPPKRLKEFRLLAEQVKRPEPRR